MRIRISSRNVFLAFSVTPICSSIERISCSSGSTSSSVIGSRSFVLVAERLDVVQVVVQQRRADSSKE